MKVLACDLRLVCLPMVMTSEGQLAFQSNADLPCLPDVRIDSLLLARLIVLEAKSENRPLKIFTARADYQPQFSASSYRALE